MTKLMSAADRAVLRRGRVGWSGFARALVVVLLLVVLAACSQEQTETTDSYVQSYVQSASIEHEANPGAGVHITSARANWESGYFVAAIVAELLRELGYEVTPPAAREMSTAVFYPAVALGVVDYWANGWFPYHYAKLKTALPRRGIVGDLASPIGTIVPHGALQGYFINKPIAQKYGITSMNAFTRPEIAEIFDRDGDGLAELIGCSEGWACHSYINEQIEAHGWLMEQISGDYSTMFQYVVSRVRAGKPVLYWSWTPSYMMAELVPGRDVRWLEAPSPEDTDTTVPDLAGCADNPCETGFVVSSIRIVANDEFLGENPAARRLFELIRIHPRAIYRQNLKMHRDKHTTEADINASAEQWIEAHRDKVDRWLAEARAAASSN